MELVSPSTQNFYIVHKNVLFVESSVVYNVTHENTLKNLLVELLYSKVALSNVMYQDSVF